MGAVIREQGGNELFEKVEGARVAAIRRREGAADADNELQTLVGALSPRDAGELVRGFATYFAVVNLAERINRIRRGRDHLRAGGAPQEGTLDDTVRRLAAAGLGPRK